MVAVVDEAVANLTAALEQNQMWNKMVVSNDNGTCGVAMLPHFRVLYQGTDASCRCAFRCMHLFHCYQLTGTYPLGSCGLLVCGGGLQASG